MHSKILMIKPNNTMKMKKDSKNTLILQMKYFKDMIAILKISSVNLSKNTQIETKNKDHLNYKRWENDINTINTIKALISQMIKIQKKEI